jgi:hypothetical protein
MNGPVPALNGLRVKSAPADCTTAFETIMPARSTSAPRSGANADLRLNFTVLESTTVTLSTDERSPVRSEPCVVLYRSMFHFTASASNAVPSWNFTSVRSVNVTVLPSDDVSHLSASHGMISPFGVTRTSESYIA